MEGIFDIVNGDVKISANALAIPPFNKFWNSFIDKKQAEKEIKYCAFMYKWNTPYKAFNESERKERIINHLNEYYKDKEFNLSDQYEEFEKDFIQFLNTPSIRLLNAAEQGIEFLIKEYDSLKLKQGLLDDKGKPIVDADSVSRWLARLGPAIKSYDQLKEQVKTENKYVSKAKGQSEIGFFERPKNQR